MPYLLFVTGPALITDFVKNINNFNVIYLLTQDVYTTTNQAMASSQAKEVDLLVTWLFRLTQDYYNYKMASAIVIIVFIICAVFIPEYALKEVHNSQMIGISQINASTAINKLCNTIEEVRLSFIFFIIDMFPPYLP